MITIDLHPEVDGHWGDCARTYFLRDGKVVTPEAAGYEEPDGMATEAALHALIQAKARPEMTFQELHSLIEQDIARRGYENRFCQYWRQRNDFRNLLARAGLEVTDHDLVTAG
jgi:methionine aminopeptidase